MNETHGALVIALYSRLLSLKLLPRTGWLQRGVANVESIAEHTFGVVSLALLVCDLEQDLDRGRVLAIALLHDLAETLIGDLPASARRFIGSEVKQQAERQALRELLVGLPQAEEYMELWTSYVKMSSREARLVKQLDRVEMLAQALAYERAGSRMMSEFFEDIDQGWSDEFSSVRAMVSQLIRERHALNNPLYPVE